MTSAPAEHPKADRRALRTRSALRAAFTELFFTHGYDDISVTDIAAKAGVGRSTMYQHYRGKDELLRDTVRQPFALLADAVQPESTPGQLRVVLEHFWRNRGNAASTRNESTRRALARILATMIDERLHPFWPTGAEVTGATQRRLVSFSIAQMQLGLIMAWMVGDVVVDVDGMTRLLDRSIKALVATLVSSADGN